MPLRDWRRRRHVPPRTLNEKIRFRMAHDRRDILGTFADKHAVRAYVEERIGAVHLPVLFHATTDPSSIDKDSYPREFVLKAAHGCGGSIIVTERAEPSSTLPSTAMGVGWSSFVVHPDSLTDSDQLREFAAHWLSQRYQAGPTVHEWAYEVAEPRIMVEEFLTPTDPTLTLPRDLKFHCFDGTVEFITSISGRYSDDQTVDLFSRDWTHLEVEMTNARNPVPPLVPERAGDMVDIAESLSTGIDFVRVDLYDIGDRIVFGEMTNYPQAGTAVFNPPSFDTEMGDKWTYFQSPGRPFV